MNFRSVIITHWLLIEEHEHLMDLSLFLTIRQYFHRRNDVLSILARRRRTRYYAMCMEECRNRRNTLPVTSLLHPSVSPAQKVIDSRSDQAYLTAFGVDVNTFALLLDLFSPLWNTNSPHSDGNIIHRINSQRGRHRSVTAEQGLALFLAWTQTNGKLMTLQMIFRLGHASLSKYLRFSRRILFHVLEDHPHAKICFPSGEKLQELQDEVSSRYPLLPGACLVMDGLKLNIQKSSCVLEASRYFNGWQHSHWIVNVFVFDITGKVVSCAVNAPGSYHDSTVADDYGIYQELLQVYNAHGAKTVVDSAFRTSGQFSVNLIKSRELHPEKVLKQRHFVRLQSGGLVHLLHPIRD